MGSIMVYKYYSGSIVRSFKAGKNLVTHYLLQYSLGGNEIHMYYTCNIFSELLCIALLIFLRYKVQYYPNSMN